MSEPTLTKEQEKIVLGYLFNPSDSAVIFDYIEVDGIDGFADGEFGNGEFADSGKAAIIAIEKFLKELRMENSLPEEVAKKETPKLKLKLTEEHSEVILEWLLNTAEAETIFESFRYDENFGELFESDEEAAQFNSSSDESVDAIIQCIYELRIKLGVDPPRPSEDD